MEAAATPAPEQQIPPPDEPSPGVQLFRFSTWVHVGPGAETCDEAEDGCANPLHFHAWCRLPNQFQHREIREKALAAKARRVRQLRDAQTDAYAILEDELDQLARVGDRGRAQIIDELLNRDWWRDYLEASRDVREQAEDGADPPYATVEHDQQRFAELDGLPPDQRPADEYAELERHLAAYNDAVDARHAELTTPQRQALEALDINALIDQVRDERINAEGAAVFMHVYSVQSWLAGTLSRPGADPVFADLAALEGAAPEVIDAIKSTFDDLERTQQRGGEPGKA